MNGRLLSIGNGNYDHINPPLANAINDATEVGRVFGQMGYDVQMCIDNTAGDIIEQVQNFSDSIQDGEIAVLYYAGHGCQVVDHNGLSVNCIMGKDSFMNEDNGGEAFDTSIKLQEHIIDVLNASKAMIKIFLIDACRREIPMNRGGNPQLFQTGFSSGVKSTGGSLISFSTSSGKSASDGTEGHSPYAKALLENCQQNISIEDCLKKVRLAVYYDTNNSQVSWEYTSLMGNFQFNYANVDNNQANIQQVVAPAGVYSYSQNVLADSTYTIDSSNQVDTIIQKLQTHDWYKQNDGIMKLYGIGKNDVTPNQQFIIGRNILQTAIGGEYECMSIMGGRLANFLAKWSKDGENHILNGMLYEMYFDHNAEFRGASHTKSMYLEPLVILLNSQQFETSKRFIQHQLEGYRDKLYYFPAVNNHISIEVRIQPHHLNEEFKVFTSLRINDKEIAVDETEDLFKSFKNKSQIKRQLSKELCSPLGLLDVTFDPQVADDVQIEFPQRLTRSLNIR